MSEKLPSYEDFIVDPKNLPSIDDLIIEEKLPSVDDFIEPPRPEEEIADLYNADSADYDFSSVEQVIRQLILALALSKRHKI